MKGSENFKKVIQSYLNERAKSDVLFANTLSKPNKNIDDCVSYILNEVKKSGCSGFEDQEIFGMAVHYYDEDNIEVNKSSSTSVSVVVNRKVDKKAKKNVSNPEPKPIENPVLASTEKVKAKKRKADINQMNLFDF